MNAHTGEWQCLKIVLRYSETGGSSLGARFFRRHLLNRWKQHNPQVETECVHAQWEHPEIKTHYRSGETTTLNIRNTAPRQIEEFFNLYRNSEGSNIHLRHGGPKVWTERRSIQGLWQPSVDHMMRSLKPVRQGEKARYKNTLTYSKRSKELAVQTYEGIGRWGDRSEQPKGLDRGYLQAMFNAPFAMAEQIVSSPPLEESKSAE